MTRLTWLKLGLLGCAAAGAYGAAVFTVDLVEGRKSAAVVDVLKEQGLDWVTAAPDGMQIILTGSAPDEASRFRAITVASQVTNPTHIRDRMVVPPPEDMPLLAFKVQILRNRDTVLMHGLVPAGPDAPVDFLARVRDLIPATEVSDILTESMSAPPETWGAAAELGLAALAMLPDVRVDVTADHVNVDGVAPPDTDPAAWAAEFSAQAPEGITVAVNLRQPRQRLSPFALRLSNDGDGIVVSSCAAENPEDAERISKALMAAGGRADDHCRIALGAPDAAWPEVAEAAIASLAALGRGAITISDRSVTVLPDGTVPADILASQGDALRQALPQGYQLSMLATKGITIGEDGPTLSLTRTADGPVTLRGPVPNAQDEAVLASLATARFGADNLTRVISVAPDLPQGWGLRALAATEAMAFLSEGEVDMTEERITVTGQTQKTDGIDAITAELTRTLGPDAVFVVDVTYTPPPPEQDPAIDPRICVADINSLLLDEKITFDPGSVDLNPAGLATVDEIAAILQTCPDVAMEIGGHTDSQGREEMNQLLSQARAEAILTALSARRVLTGELSAKGYGETQPIADNSSEAGREANRRIAFRLKTPEEVAQE